jgi:hypothetical protein
VGNVELLEVCTNVNERLKSVENLLVIELERHQVVLLTQTDICAFAHLTLLGEWPCENTRNTAYSLVVCARRS